MIYSVWNQGAGAFDYFEDARVQATLNAEKPSHLVSRTLGSTIEQAAWPLPLDARPIGRGEVPVGRVAVRKGVGALSDAPDIFSARWALGLAAFVVALKVAGIDPFKPLFSKKRRRR